MTLGDIASVAASVAVAAIRQADDDAEQAQLAFVLGKFGPYFEKKAAAAQRRLEEKYLELERQESNTSGTGEGAAGGGEPSVHGPQSDRS
jgi:hypothetical protein